MLYNESRPAGISSGPTRQFLGRDSASCSRLLWVIPSKRTSGRKERDGSERHKPAGRWLRRKRTAPAFFVSEGTFARLLLVGFHWGRSRWLTQWEQQGPPSPNDSEPGTQVTGQQVRSATRILAGSRHNPVLPVRMLSREAGQNCSPWVERSGTLGPNPFEGKPQTGRRKLTACNAIPADRGIRVLGRRRRRNGSALTRGPGPGVRVDARKRERLQS